MIVDDVSARAARFNFDVNIFFFFLFPTYVPYSHYHCRANDLFVGAPLSLPLSPRLSGSCSSFVNGQTVRFKCQIVSAVQIISPPYPSMTRLIRSCCRLSLCSILCKPKYYRRLSIIILTLHDFSLIYIRLAVGEDVVLRRFLRVDGD